MDHFHYQNGQLLAEDVALVDIAKQWGTPCYVYSKATLARHYRVVDEALGDHPHQIYYSVKANPNLAILNLLAKWGAGFDIVSVGELERVLVAGGNAHKVIFSGVGKSEMEMRRALEVGIHCFNVESESELERLQQVAAAMNKVAPISLRVNPDIDAKSHPYISTGLKQNKFGIDYAQALRVYQRAQQMANVEIIGADCHIGSQITELAPFLDAMDRMLALIDALAEEGIVIQHLDMGGGLGVPYLDEEPPSPATYAQALIKRLDGRSLQIVLEPGRVIVGNAGILLTRVEYIKSTSKRHFAVIDAAMNDLLRPALYQAWQTAIPVVPDDSVPTQRYDIVGPICETADFLAKDRPLAIKQGDLLAIRTAGAYGFTMSSNYNSRPRVAELLVDGDKVHEIRQRETVADLFATETIPEY